MIRPADIPPDHPGRRLLTGHTVLRRTHRAALAPTAFTPDPKMTLTCGKVVAWARRLTHLNSTLELSPVYP